jgi:hypothetical protein
MNMTPNGPGAEAWSRKTLGIWTKMLKLAWQGALSKPWRRQRQGPTCRREQVSNWPRSVGEQNGAESGRKGPISPSWPGLFRAQFTPSFDLCAPLYIASASIGRHIHPFIRETPTRRRSTGRKPTAVASTWVA